MISVSRSGRNDSSGNEEDYDTSEKDSDVEGPAVKPKHIPSMRSVQRKCTHMKHRSKSTPFPSHSKAGASKSTIKRPKSMGCTYNSSEDENSEPLRANRKKRQKFKSKIISAAPSPLVVRSKSNLSSGTKEESDDIQTVSNSANPKQVPVCDHHLDSYETFVSGSDIETPRSKPKRATLRTSGEELSYESHAERPCMYLLPSDKPKPFSPVVNQQLPFLQSSVPLDIQEQGSYLSPILPFPNDIPGPEEACDLVQPMYHAVLVLLNRQISFCPDQEVSCHCTVFVSCIEQYVSYTSITEQQPGK